jgi:hypothetical protein
MWKGLGIGALTTKKSGNGYGTGIHRAKGRVHGAMGKSRVNTVMHVGKWVLAAHQRQAV